MAAKIYLTRGHFISSLAPPQISLHVIAAPAVVLTACSLRILKCHAAFLKRIKFFMVLIPPSWVRKHHYSIVHHIPVNISQ